MHVAPLRETFQFTVVKQNAANQKSPKEKYLQYFILWEVFTICSPSFG